MNSIKVYAFVGPSGTGKSYRAQMVAGENNINYIIDEFKKKPLLLKFISKNLSWGIYNKSLIKIYEKGENNETSFYNLFLKGIKENSIKLKNPEVNPHIFL